MTCKSAAGNTRTKNPVNSQLHRNGDYYLPNSHTVCAVVPIQAVPWINAPQKPQCTDIYVFEKPLTSPTPSLPHNSPSPSSASSVK